MKRALAAVLLMTGIAFHASAQRPPLEFKGLKPGGDPGAILTSSDWKCRPRERSEGVTDCITTKETIAGVQVDMVFVSVKDGLIRSIAVDFPERNFHLVYDALKVKFGEPDSASSQEIQNRMGAKFVNEIKRWFDGRPETGGTYMSARRFGRNLTLSSLYLTIAPSSDDAKKSAEQEKKKRSEDL